MKSYSIYLIHNEDYWYVGSTIVDAKKRYQQHMSGRNSGAPRLQEKIRELGAEGFSFMVLEYADGDHEQRIAAERKWYDHLMEKDCRQTLNGKPPGGWVAHTPEIDAKISASNMGHPNHFTSGHTEKSKAKIGAGRRGQRHTAEANAKNRAAHLGKVASPETKAKMSTTRKGRTPWNKGIPATPEHRAKISAGLMGNTNWKDSHG